MNEKEYDVLKAKVMESLDGDEIAELIFQYELNEYSVIKLSPLWQHMRACLCRLGVQRAYGVDLTWSESDVDVLHRVAIDLHNSLTSAKTGFKTNLTAQKAITEELAEKKENFDMILEELKKRYAKVEEKPVSISQLASQNTDLAVTPFKKYAPLLFGMTAIELFIKEGLLFSEDEQKRRRNQMKQVEIDLLNHQYSESLKVEATNRKRESESGIKIHGTYSIKYDFKDNNPPTALIEIRQKVKSLIIEGHTISTNDTVSIKRYFDDSQKRKQFIINNKYGDIIGFFSDENLADAIDLELFHMKELHVERIVLPTPGSRTYPEVVIRFKAEFVD